MSFFFCFLHGRFSSVQSLSLVRLFAAPWTAAFQASLSITNSRSLFKLMSIESVMSSNYLILCHSLLLLPSIFPSIRVFSNESLLRIRWPEYWSFSFSSSPSNERSGLIEETPSGNWLAHFHRQRALQSPAHGEQLLSTVNVWSLKPEPQVAWIYSPLRHRFYEPFISFLCQMPTADINPSHSLDICSQPINCQLLSLGSKITADGDCNHEIKRCLFLGRKSMTNLDATLKGRDVTFPTKVHIIKAMVFPVDTCGCESWTIRKAEWKDVMLLSCGVGEDSWESLVLQGDQTGQS